MPNRPLQSTLAAGILALVCAFTAPAAARDLHWTALEVEARLEDDGTLRVSELQRFVFDGDWNGGERKFHLRFGQKLELDRLIRVDPATGEERELVAGDLSEVDEYSWADWETLRWRSRRPGDPPFQNRHIDYRIDYRLIGVLVPRGERRYALDHDFAFPDRDGAIERVDVRLVLGEDWRATGPLPVSWSGGPLPPGSGFVVRVELEATGEALPALATPPRLPPPIRHAALVLFAVAIGLFFLRFRIRERALGRFAEPGGDTVDRAWLEAKVFSHPPEVVGAAWDRAIGAAEVAAMLARLTQEGKLASEVKRKGGFFARENLALRLLVDRASLSPSDERPLIEGLFGLSDETDSDAIRKRYASSGFDPASRIRDGVGQRLARIRGFESGSPKPKKAPTALLLLAGILVLGASIVLEPTLALAALLVPLALFVAWLPGLAGAMAGQGRVRIGAGPRFAFAISLGAMATVLWFFSGWPRVNAGMLAGALLLAAGFVRALFNLLATRESAESLARRRELLRARDFFARELRQENPRLEDRWFPYLLAFGLAPGVDRWFRRFGGATRAGSATISTGGGGSFAGSGGSASGWSGGGGAFGGGGATATWAMAATAMSAGVSRPSSSGGSGGGGGGGGSSGGGGGGGW